MEVQTNTYMLICRNKSVKTQLSHRKKKEKKKQLSFLTHLFLNKVLKSTHHTH